MNKFYQISGGIPCKESKNVYPQVLRTTAAKGTKLYDEVTKLRNKPNPNSKGLIIELELDQKTTPTDFISQSWIGSVGLLVSLKAFEFLSNFTLQPEMEVYDAKINHKGKSYDYKWLNPTYDYDEVIDFDKTKFFLYDVLEKTEEPIEITDPMDLVDKVLMYSPIPVVKTKHLMLTDQKILKYDLFFISIGSTHIRVSEKLKTELEKSSLSAVEFKDPISIE